MLKCSDEFLDSLYKLNVYLGYNCAPPSATHYGWMKVGVDLNVSSQVMIEANSGIQGGPYWPSAGGKPFCGLFSIGSFSYAHSAIPAPVNVGRYCSISTGLKFLDSHHPLELVTSSLIGFAPHNKLLRGYIPMNVRATYPFNVQGKKPFPSIEHDVWIGRDVMISMGVVISTGAVVAAGSMVTKDVPPYAIVGGNPAKIIRYRFDERTIDALLKSRWWRFRADVIYNSVANLDKPLEFCKKIDELERSMKIFPYTPSYMTVGPNGFTVSVGDSEPKFT